MNPNPAARPRVTHSLALAAALFSTGACATRAAEIDPESDPQVRPHAGVVDGYRLLFSDEFNGDAVDETKWTPRTGSKLWSTQLPENNAVAGGLYRIHLRKQQAGDKDYTGGGLISKKLYRHGYYETRMKTPEGQGWHPAFWMMRDVAVQDVPAGEAHIELDVMENNTSDPFHFQTDAHRWRPGNHVKYATRQIVTDTPLTEWHVFGMEFTPTELRYFFDGELVRATDASRFPHNDVNIWLSCIAGKMGQKTTAVDDSTLPSQLQFDYVRLFEKDPAAAVADTTPARVSVSDDGTVTHRLRHGAGGYVGQNTYLRGADPGRNVGDDDELMVGRWQGAPVTSLLAFPLDEVDADAEIESAELHLWNIDGTGEVRAVALRVAQTPFVEGDGDGFTNENNGAGSGADWNTSDGKTPWKQPGGDVAPAVLSGFAGGYDARKVQPLFFPSTPLFVEEVQRALAAGEPLRLAIDFEERETGGNALTRFASNRSVIELRPELRLTHRENTPPSPDAAP